MNQIVGKFPFLGQNSIYSQALGHYEQGNFEQAIEGFSRIISQPKKAGIFHTFSLFYLKESYLHLGFAYEHLGMYDKAVEHLAAAARISGNYADIHYHLGQCLCSLGEFDRAEQELRRALEINPRYTAAISLLGFTYVKLRRLNEAAECYRKALEINPRYADFYYLLGSIHGLAHRFNAAMKEFQKALEVNPHYREARIKMALIEECSLSDRGGELRKTDCNQKLLEEFSRVFAAPPIDVSRPLLGPSVQLTEGDDIISNTILFYEKAVLVNPNYADLHYQLGMYYAKKGLHQRAIETFLKSLKINPGYVQAMISLALTYLKAGEIDQSISMILKAIAAQPHYPDLHYYLGTLYAEKGNMPDAVGEFEKALAINPDYPECRAALAMAYEKQGKKEQAALHWNLYLKGHIHTEGEEEMQRYIGRNLAGAGE
ncbi:MAG: tetratricopeptide repeat protein [bacterium]